MAKQLGIQLVHSGGTLSFTSTGAFSDDERRSYKPSSHPRELTRIERTWVLTEALLTAATPELLFDAWASFRALCNAREPSITAARLVRDPSGTPVVEDVLGPSTYQEFRIEAVGVDTYGESPSATLRSVVPLTITLTAVQVFADDDGIVDFDQRLVLATSSGLEDVTLVTEITTAEGTDARTKARTYALLDMEVYGGTNYTWHPSSNNDDGMEIEVLDLDTRDTARVPTRVRATSRVQQHRVTHGGGGGSPGQKIDAPFLERRTIVEGTETRIMTVARATGPGAATWVRARRPVGAIKSSSLTESLTEHRAEGEWTQASSDALSSRSDLKVEVSGGGQDMELVPTPVGLSQLALGPIMPYTITVTLELIAYGEAVKRADMLLPAQLPAPFVLMRAGSREDAHPRKADESAADPTGRKWSRSASYTYQLSALQLDPSLLLPLYEEGTSQGVLT